MRPLRRRGPPDRGRWARSWDSSWARRRGRWTGPRCRPGCALAWEPEALEAPVRAPMVLSHHDHDVRPRRDSLADGWRLGEDDPLPLGIGHVHVLHSRDEPRVLERAHRVLFGHAGHGRHGHARAGLSTVALALAVADGERHAAPQRGGRAAGWRLLQDG